MKLCRREWTVNSGRAAFAHQKRLGNHVAIHGCIGLVYPLQMKSGLCQGSQRPRDLGRKPNEGGKLLDLNRQNVVKQHWDDESRWSAGEYSMCSWGLESRLPDASFLHRYESRAVRKSFIPPPNSLAAQPLDRSRALMLPSSENRPRLCTCLHF